MEKQIPQHRLALFCSGSGSNAQAIIDFFHGHQSIAVCCLLANRADAFALERAKTAGIPTLVFNREEWRESEVVDGFLRSQGATCLVLAGFLWLVPQRLLAQYPGFVLNIHPALLPSFGGKGMWGHHVHQAVSEAGVSETGITIHLADAAYDEGQILHQERVPIVPNCAPELVEAAIRPLELAHYAPTIERYLLGKAANRGKMQ